MASGKSWAERKKQHQNTAVSTRITLRGDLLAEVERLEAEMTAAAEIDKRENRDQVAPRIAEQIQAVQDEAAESEVTFTFQGLGRGAYAKLIARHSPTDDQKRLFTEAGGEGELEYNFDTFPPALLAVCCVEPAELKDDVPEWTEIHTEWNGGQVFRLWEACLAANQGVAETPKSQAASAVLARHSSASSSTSASP